MSAEERDVIRNIINILAREDCITVDEKIRMLESLNRRSMNESAG